MQVHALKDEHHVDYVLLAGYLKVLSLMPDAGAAASCDSHLPHI